MARVWRGLNLTIRQGETLVVMGESGSGKTTLCRVLAGDLAFARALYQPGDVCIFDEPTSALDERTGYELVRAMINALQGHTVVIVTHDVRVADILREKGASVCMLQTMNAKTA